MQQCGKAADGIFASTALETGRIDNDPVMTRINPPLR
jgi:hypothetical protein